MLALRQEVSKALEEARAAKLIGSSLEAKVLIEAPQAVAEAMSQIEDPEGFFIVSQLEVKTVTAPAEETQVLKGRLPGCGSRYPEVTVPNAPDAGCGLPTSERARTTRMSV